MTARNHHFTKLKSQYLFPEINARKAQYLEKHPEAKLISLGIGDTTEPIPLSITSSLAGASQALGTLQGYSGYGPEQGKAELREKIASQVYSNKVRPEDIFISDGSKCDIGRLQTMFGNAVSIAVQDPAYPVYVEGSILQGVQEIVYLPCLPENNFFPDLQKAPRTDLIYFCSPNNPTGATASYEQLKQLVAFAKKNRSIIIYDSAYASYIQGNSVPKTIFEIEGAEQVALETGSFSKMAGFTGVRLGWTVVPQELAFDDGSSVKADWKRLTSTIFNGASNIAQSGGLGILGKQGLQEIQNLAVFYMENVKIIRNALEKTHHEIYGGVHAPFLWVRFKGQKSWDLFQHFLEKAQLITTPGSGFGPSGEGFLRFSAFGHRENVEEAAQRLIAVVV